MRHVIANTNDTLEECRCLLFFVIIFLGGWGECEDVPCIPRMLKCARYPSVVSRAPRLLTLGMRGMLFANLISVALFAIQITCENMSTTID